MTNTVEEFPLVVPPTENEDAEVSIREASRENAVVFQRKAIRDLQDSLTPALQDAMREIGEAKYLYDNPGGLRMMSYGRIPGGAGGDLADWQIERKRDYEEWCRRMWTRSPVSLSIVKRICQEEDSVRQIEKDEGISSVTVKRMLEYGLTEYAHVKGWIKN